MCSVNAWLNNCASFFFLSATTISLERCLLVPFILSTGISMLVLFLYSDFLLSVWKIVSHLFLYPVQIWISVQGEPGKSLQRNVWCHPLLYSNKLQKQSHCWVCNKFVLNILLYLHISATFSQNYELLGRFSCLYTFSNTNKVHR